MSKSEASGSEVVRQAERNSGLVEGERGVLRRVGAEGEASK